MIQPTAPAPFTAIGLPSEAAVLPADQPAEGADFGALLAQQGPAAAPIEGAQLTAAGAEVLPDPAATPGKILPLALPEPASEVPPPEPPPVLPHPAAATLALRTLKLGVKAERTQSAVTEPVLAVESDEPALSVVGTADPLLLSAVLPELAPKFTVTVPSAATSQQPAEDAELTTEIHGQGALQRTVPTLPESASVRAQSQMLRHVPVTAPLLSGLAAQAAQSMPQPTATLAPSSAIQVTQTATVVAPPAEEVRVDLALPRLAVPIAMNRDEAGPVAKLSELVLPEATPEGANPLAPAVQQVMPSLPASPAPQVRPHDFAALIERIAVAREAAAPQAVSITVSHQDFGQVRLSFRPEDTGLSVAMSSADPGFARAAAALSAPILPVGSTDQASLGQQQRSDNASAQTGGQSQSRAGSADPRREGQSQPQSNPAPRSRRDHTASRSGIFA